MENKRKPAKPAERPSPYDLSQQRTMADIHREQRKRARPLGLPPNRKDPSLE